MKYVLVEVYRRSIGLFYYDDEKKGTGAFEVVNGSVPLAIAYINGRFEVGQTALIAVKNGQAEAYDNLFGLMDKDVSCGGESSIQLIPTVIRQSLEDYFTSKRGGSYRDFLDDITLVLLYGNDVMEKECEKVTDAFKKDGFASVKPMSQSVEAIKCFRMSPKHNWSRENDAMVVRSDGVDLSIKCFSLSDYHLTFEHFYKNKGSDPRFDWALNKLWNDVSAKTYLNKDEASPAIAEILESFIASSRLELTEIRLSDGVYAVYLTKKQYETYTPPNATTFVSLISDIVKDTGQKYETTGIVLQGKTANNGFFHKSFELFDPISDETDEFRCEIRDYVLKQLLGVKPTIVVPIVSIVSFDGTKFKVNVGFDGGAAVTNRGVCWSQHHNPTEAADSFISKGLGQGDFEVDLSELQSGKTFYARAFATNSVGTGYSEEVTFTTGIDSGFADDPNDDGRRKFAMDFSVGRQGLTKTLTVNVEILDGKRLPFDCMFTIDSEDYKSYRPEESFCEKCERGKSGVLEFGPYELPLEKVGASDMLYAHIWPADKEKSPNIFRKNHLKIKL